MFFKPVLPVLEYIVFYDYIKTELCENKDKVELQCNGKCHLAKELAKASDTQKDNKDKKLVSVETTLVFCKDLEAFLALPIVFISSKNKICTYYNSLYAHLRIAKFLRPPIYSV